MKKKMIALVIVSGTVLQGGCFFNSLARNVWRGFGYSLGGIPAGIVVDLVIDPILNPPADDPA